MASIIDRVLNVLQHDCDLSRVGSCSLKDFSDDDGSEYWVDNTVVTEELVGCNEAL